MKTLGIGLAVTAALLGNANYAAASTADVTTAGPLMNADAITWVQPVRKPYLVEAPVGAAIILKASSGVTAESVSRSLEQHAAWMSNGGNEVPAMANCPLAFDKEKIRVTAGSEGVEIQITSSDPNVGPQILERVSTLAAGQGPSTVKGHTYPDYQSQPAGEAPRTVKGHRYPQYD